MSDAPPNTEEPEPETWPRYTREELLYGDPETASEEESEHRPSGPSEEEDESGRGSPSRRAPLYELLTPHRGS